MIDSIKFTIDFKFLIPEIFLTFTICLILFFGLLNSGQLRNTNSNFYLKLTNQISVLSFLSFSFLIFILFSTLISLNFTTYTQLNNILLVDTFSTFIKIIISLLSLPIIHLSKLFLSQEKLNLYEFYILYHIFVLSLFFLISSNDFLIFYLSIELQSLILYVLISLKRSSIFSVEAGLKYFILSSVASGFLLFGISTIYGFTAIINFKDLSKIFLQPPYFGIELLISHSLLFGFLFVLIPVFFKLSLAPFHIWTPDVYQGSPSIVTLIMSIIPKIVFIGILFKFDILYFYFTQYYWFYNWYYSLMYFISIASIFIGVLGSLAQSNLKRILAYSTISHIGFMFFCYSQSTFDSIAAVLVYFFIYAILVLNFFVVILSVCNIYTREHIENISELPTLFSFNPTLTIALTGNLFSIAGIPPLAGFWVKYLVLQEIFINFSFISSFLALYFIIFSSISCFYYLRMVRFIFFEEKDLYVNYFSLNRVSSHIIILGLIFNLLGFLKLDLLFNIAQFIVYSISN